ncbi:hypothetical protein TBLA_0A07660 [Henningerozyma blattae CBS 6284]|uniref:Uncharacterized protein n=1 Tax=Henningerozyma blattae (strain ATCC 34711 / CBS 6284 / DSM 70876 / NBRC 10599 / NRRL Y-10934 / UCD 77-7) TaxID=1071380 RepID=I2GWQ3_HENB6|nr:hypothetical protein TBLA_0A07660 [Tetrapisispora blattae CBS 6284]CCH58555.1 hypothetical protein TBLA_0A07660 [Tetrapisispora blattae CBS 6284]
MDKQRIRSMTSIHPQPPQQTSRVTAPTHITISANMQVHAPTKASTKAPSKNPSSWDPADDLLLRHLKEVRHMGWKDIALHFDRRTSNACQFRWRRLKSGSLKANRTALVDIHNIDLGDLPLHAQRTAPEPAAKKSPSREIVFSTPDFTNANAVATTNATANTNTNVNANVGTNANANANTNANGDSNNNTNNNSIAATPCTASTPANTVTSTTTITTSNNISSAFHPPKHVPASVSSSAATAPDSENVGFVPRIHIKSRRSSISTPLSSIPPTPSFSTYNPKSFLTRSRRSSFNTLSPFSTPTTTRRSSLVSFHSTTNNAIVHPRRNSTMVSNHNSYLDSAKMKIHHLNNNNSWSLDEDKLLFENNKRRLSIMELSILLPHKSESQIKGRLDSISHPIHNNPTSINCLLNSPPPINPNPETQPQPQAEMPTELENHIQAEVNDINLSIHNMPNQPIARSFSNSPSSTSSNGLKEHSPSIFSTSNSPRDINVPTDDETDNNTSSEESRMNSNPKIINTLPSINTIFKNII